MKYNKFLMALALCVGISANTNYCAETPTSWSGLGYSALTSAPRTVYHYGKQAFKYGAGLLGKGINIPSSVFNAMAEWSVNKTIMVVGAGITILGVWYGPRETLEWVTNLIGGTSQSKLGELENPYSFSEKKTQGKTYQATQNRFMQMFKDKSLSPIAIAQLQNKFANSSNYYFINDALKSRYYDEYLDEIKKIDMQNRPAKIKELMSNVSDPSSPQRQVLLQKIDLEQEIMQPSTKGPFDGLNWGQGGLRYQALDDLFNATHKSLQK